MGTTARINVQSRSNIRVVRCLISQSTPFGSFKTGVKHFDSHVDKGLKNGLGLGLPGKIPFQKDQSSVAFPPESTASVALSCIILGNLM